MGEMRETPSGSHLVAPLPTLLPRVSMLARASAGGRACVCGRLYLCVSDWVTMSVLFFENTK